MKCYKGPKPREVNVSLTVTWGPPIHNMGLCGRPGEDPNAWKQFGQETTGQ